MVSIFRGRWCVMSTCCLPQLRERSEQRSGDFGVARLGGATALNIQRLVHRPFDFAWDVINSHLLFVLRHPAVLLPVHQQAARTLDHIFAIVPHPHQPPSNLQATVRCCAAGRSGTLDHAWWTRTEREHGALPLVG